MANPSTVSGCCALVERDAGSDHGNRESYVEAISRSDVMARRFFRRARFEHDSGGSLEPAPAPAPMSAPPIRKSARFGW